MNQTSIGWCDFSSNPLKYRDADGRVVWACQHASLGCKFCYAEALATRFGKGAPFAAREMRALTPFLDDKELRAMRTFSGRIPGACECCMGSGSDPTGADHLRCGACAGTGARRARVFVGDMTDLFGEWVPDAMLHRLFSEVVEQRCDVTWILLTKRAQRLKEYLSWRWRDRLVSRHIMVGVSAEDQRRADERIPLLLQTPAAMRFVSLEPLLGPINLRELAHQEDWHVDALDTPDPSRRLDWVIVGGESGPSARPCDQGWLSSLVYQCRMAGVPCFLKQWGSAPFFGPERHWLDDRKGANPAEWPPELRVREFPSQAPQPEIAPGR